MHIFGGQVEFEIIVPGWTEHALKIDATVQPTYISLESENVRFWAAKFRILALGDIWRVGCVNVIHESRRCFHYTDGTQQTESIDTLPTWDGDEDGVAPFYFGNCYSTRALDEGKEGIVELLEVGEFITGNE